jgi:hypothetical protein
VPHTRLAAALLALAAALLLTGCTAAGPLADAGQGGSGAADGAAGTAGTGVDLRFDLATVTSQLKTVQVKRVDPYNGYDRVKDFGDAWLDVDGNGCDTRSDILRRDLADVSPSTGCKVDSGVLHDPYSGKTVDYRRGKESSEAVQIDHVVPVYEAWRTGAQAWTQQKREALANDPLNLIAVDGDANQDKGDLDPERWLPPLKSYRCAYVERYVTVLAKYDLTVPSSEMTALTRLLGACPA